jgi:MFS transporter, SIT family, siderophore-iron:H+ symporter
MDDEKPAVDAAIVATPDNSEHLKAPGVARVEAISSLLTRPYRIVLFLDLFVIAYAYGIDSMLRIIYQNDALGSYSAHGMTPAVSVTCAVASAIAQPATAKAADVFGRFELVCVSILFYVTGTLIQSISRGVAFFAGGAAI